jgi:hypothetical protein
MLPDFINIKQATAKSLINLVRKEVAGGDPFLSQIRRRTVHEGHKLKMQAHEGEGSIVGFEEIEAAFSARHEEIIKDGPDAFIGPLLELATELQGKEAGLVFRRLEEITDATGNVVDARGREFSPELLLEMIEKADMGFDEQGNVTSQIVISPRTMELVRDKLEEWYKDPGNKARVDALLDRKRQEWRDRENNRKLVD